MYKILIHHKITYLEKPDIFREEYHGDVREERLGGREGEGEAGVH